MEGFWTVTVTGLDVPTLPEGSSAVTVNVLAPFAAVVLFQLIAYGGEVTGEPSGWPLRKNCTPRTPSRASSS